MASEPPRPSVVTSCAVETPWKPATSTIAPSASASWIRRGRISSTFARVWSVSVTTPACEPVSEIAVWPRSWIAIAASAHEIRSPTESSMSSSRGCGAGEIWWASSTRSSVAAPIAERTPTTSFPAARAATSRCATAFSRSGPSTDVPPNFWTRRPMARSYTPREWAPLLGLSAEQDHAPRLLDVGQLRHGEHDRVTDRGLHLRQSVAGRIGDRDQQIALATEADRHRGEP